MKFVFGPAHLGLALFSSAALGFAACLLVKISLIVDHNCEDVVRTKRRTRSFKNDDVVDLAAYRKKFR